MIGFGEPHEYDLLWGATLVSMIDIEPDCGWPIAKSVSGRGQERGPVPRPCARAKNRGQYQLL